MRTPRLTILSLGAVLLAACASPTRWAETHQEAPKPDETRTVLLDRRSADFAAAQQRMFDLLEPYAVRARASWPGPARMLEAGDLASDATALVLYRPRDAAGRAELLWLRVVGVAGGRIRGVVDAPVNVVDGLRRGDEVTIADTALVDWVVRRQDGTYAGGYLAAFVADHPEYRTYPDFYVYVLPASR